MCLWRRSPCTKPAQRVRPLDGMHRALSATQLRSADTTNTSWLQNDPPFKLTQSDLQAAGESKAIESVTWNWFQSDVHPTINMFVPSPNLPRRLDWCLSAAIYRNICLYITDISGFQLSAGGRTVVPLSSLCDADLNESSSGAQVALQEKNANGSEKTTFQSKTRTHLCTHVYVCTYDTYMIFTKLRPCGYSVGIPEKKRKTWFLKYYDIINI